MIKIKRFEFNVFQENTYVLYDETNECVIVDAGCYTAEEENILVQFISNEGLKPVKLLNTHCHIDHILGVNYCREKYGIPFYAHSGDDILVEKAVPQGSAFGFIVQPIKNPDNHINECDIIHFGSSSLEALFVPGHSLGSIVFYSAGQKFLLTGDVLFHGSIGRTDLPGGNYDMLINNITNKLLPLPEDTIVYPGHGPHTSIGFEKKNNPFLTGKF